MYYERFLSYTDAFEDVDAVTILVEYANGDVVESSLIPHTDEAMSDLHEDLIAFNEGHPLGVWNKDLNALTYVYPHQVRAVRIRPITTAT